MSNSHQFAWQNEVKFVQMPSAHDAAFLGNVAMLNASLSEGNMINEPLETSFSNACSTPLHVASQHGHKNCVKVLLEQGADAALVDCWGHTAAHLAALEGYDDVLEVCFVQCGKCRHSYPRVWSLRWVPGSRFTRAPVAHYGIINSETS
jgi:hypothetical protein